MLFSVIQGYAGLWFKSKCDYCRGMNGVLVGYEGIALPRYFSSEEINACPLGELELRNRQKPHKR